MNNPLRYVSYVDLLGIGAASLENTESYHQNLSRFRLALCLAVDRHLRETDEVFAFSDCAFAVSANLQRMSSYIMELQYDLWKHDIFLKGAISVLYPDNSQLSNPPGQRKKVSAKPKENGLKFAELQKQSASLIAKREKILKGYWFEKEFVKPALLEKKLKGVAIQVDESIKDLQWINNNVVASCYFPSESSKKIEVINDLIIPSDHLQLLEDLLKTYMRISHGSHGPRRLSRYYVPLIVTWIRSYDYSGIKLDAKTGNWNSAPVPLRQLILNSKIASEVTSLVGGDVIFYSLLTKVFKECHETKVTEYVFDFIARNKKLRAAAENMPNEICPSEIRNHLIDSRIRYLFDSTSDG
jgi:hypothetical protein